MSCPRDWEGLLAHRFDPRQAPPADWRQASAHLDRCPDCLRRAEAIDPTLLFRALPEIEIGDDEVAEMQRAVATLKASSALRPQTRGWRLRRLVAAREARGERPRTLLRLAAAVLLVVGLGTGTALLPGDGESSLEAGGAVAESFEPVTGWTELEPPVEDAPIVEGVVSPVARVYSFPAPDEEVAVVMVIDPTLDV